MQEQRMDFHEEWRADERVQSAFLRYCERFQARPQWFRLRQLVSLTGIGSNKAG